MGHFLVLIWVHAQRVALIGVLFRSDVVYVGWFIVCNCVLVSADRTSWSGGRIMALAIERPMDRIPREPDYTS